MTITLPEIEAVERLSPDELRLELACALYARGLIGKVAGAEVAGVGFFDFQRGLGERGIPMRTGQMFEDDMANLDSLFPQ
jgi:predicted HTH domain antitoxin